jgi:hypothetical protein
VLQNITVLRLFYLIIFLKNCWMVGLFCIILFFLYICLIFLFNWKNISYLFFGLWNTSLWKVEYGIMFLTDCGNINTPSPKDLGLN